MTEIRDALGLDRDELPDYSTIYKSLDQLKMWGWRALLRVEWSEKDLTPLDALSS
jgi:hypothetical protein